MTDSAQGRDVTLFVGAPTRLGTALNDFVRINGVALRAGGVEPRPNRLVTKALRAAIGGTDNGASLAALLQVNAGVRPFLSALNGLGRPTTALRKSELFPEAERMLLGAAGVLGHRVGRVVLAVEPIHSLFLSIGFDDLAERVRNTRWEVLYEVSWADLAREVRAAFADTEIVVLTPFAVRDGATPLLHYLFGSVGFELADEVAGVTFLNAARTADQSTEVYAKIGIDHVTTDLLNQRFAEDMKAMAAMPGVRVM